MNPAALFMADDSGGQVQRIAQTFGVDWPHLMAQIISFSIVCFLLYKYAYRPVLAILDQRRRQIERGIADSEKIQAELAQTEAERHHVLIEAGTQANQIIAEALAAAAQLRKKESEKAIATAEQIVTKARETTVQEHSRMLTELKGELGLLVVRATAQLTGKVLTPDDQQRMAEETIQQVARAA
jgi:F-type H+-transporting ATPase subunit b